MVLLKFFAGAMLAGTGWTAMAQAVTQGAAPVAVPAPAPVAVATPTVAQPVAAAAATAPVASATASATPPASAVPPALAAPVAAPATAPVPAPATLAAPARVLAAAAPARAAAPATAPVANVRMAAPEKHPDDDTFVLLRDAARLDNASKAAEVGARLGSYPIPSYVEYYKLKPRLRSASAAEIRDYLARYHGTAIADRLRNDWLLELGRARDWVNFDQELPQFVLGDDLQVKCYALMSRAVKGERVADEARALLLSPPSYGEGCSALIATLAQNGQFTTADLLAQLRLAGEAHATGPARRIAALLGVSETLAAQAVDVPAVAMARGIGATPAEHAVYLVALSRMSRTSQKLAAIALRKNAPLLSPQEVAIGWAGIAHSASIAVSPDAAEYWALSSGAPLTHEQLQWKTRIALRHGQWDVVRSTIESMPPQLRNQNTWVYWHARSLQAAGLDGATAQYRRIAEPTSFYGQLALEELGQKIVLPPAGTPLSADEVNAMANNPGLKRALKFFSMRLRPEGSREWNWELRKLSEREILAAAEVARRHDILDRMVSTSERTRTLFDFTQRFPSPHFEILQPTTTKLGLDKAWVYGLIRQESRFIQDAQSTVGASGLMQVMPATAAWVARKIGLADYVHGKLNDLHTNLVLGANYMNMVLQSADGSQPMASAAYNAGPGRMRTWRAALNAPMEGAIFAETIPFMETRIYVKNVMANATTYAALFENKPQSLKARLGTVGPRTRGGIDLP